MKTASWIEVLSHLRIRDLIVVEEATLEFSPGFNVLSGSTGAGKSVLLAALSLVTGSRAQSDWIRPDAERALVSAFFLLDDTLRDRLRAAGFDAREGELLLEREIRHGGRGRASLDGFPLPVRRLRELGELLLERQDQHEQLGLLESERQLAFLDQHARNREDLARYRVELDRVRRLRNDEEALKASLAKLRQDEDYLRFQLDEIDAVAPVPGEMDDLVRREKRLRNASRIQAQLKESLDLLETGDRSLLTLLGRLEKTLAKLETLDSDDEDGDSALLPLLSENLHELAQSLRIRRDEISHGADEGEGISRRLGKLYALERKHSRSLGEIVAWADEQREVLAGLAEGDRRLTEQASKRSAAEQDLSHAAAVLSEGRREAASALGLLWQDRLAGLGMGLCTLRVSVAREEHPDGWIELEGRRYRAGSSGIDQVRVLVRTNPDLPEGGLREVPSGGELSRIALARHLLGRGEDIAPCLILDEVDAGLGADLARTLAVRLRELASERQVVLVTHQASLAAAAERQFCVRKAYSDGRTRVDVVALEGEERVKEISRMLGDDGAVAERGETRSLAEALLDKTV